MSEETKAVKIVVWPNQRFTGSRPTYRMWSAEVQFSDGTSVKCDGDLGHEHKTTANAIKCGKGRLQK